VAVVVRAIIIAQDQLVQTEVLPEVEAAVATTATQVKVEMDRFCFLGKPLDIKTPGTLKARLDKMEKKKISVKN
jgi:hypothetical protein